MCKILIFVCLINGITWCFADVKFSVVILEDNSVSCEQSEGKPAKAIVLENEDLKLSISPFTLNNYFKCVGKSDPYDVFVKNPDLPPRTLATSLKATPQMSGLWACTIYTNKDVGIPPVVNVDNKDLRGQFTGLYCYVDVHVRLLKTPQTVLINNIAIPTVRSNNTEEEFDHSAVYYYINGDIVTVQCLPGTDALKDTENRFPIEFKYDFAENLDNMFKEQLEGSRSKLFGFRTKLQARHDKSVMVCKYHGKNDYTTIKVTFVLVTIPDSVGYITINKLIARPFQGYDGLNSEVNYFSFYGEKVEIACTSNQYYLGAAGKQENCETGGTTFTKSLITPFVYNCYLCEKWGRNYNIKVSTNRLHLDFKENKKLHADLPDDNILIELFKYDGEERKSWIYYEFEEGDRVQPNCIYSKDESSQAVLEVVYKFNNKESKTSKQLTLTPGHDNVFECVLTDKMDSSKQATVIMNRIRILFRMRPGTPTTTTTTTANTTTSQMAPVESWKPNMTVSIIFCVAAVVSVFGISFACRTCLKKKKAGDTQNTTSSNRLQSRPLPDVPVQTEPLDCYDYVYSSSDYAELEINETRNENRNQQNTMYYWINQFSSNPT